MSCKDVASIVDGSYNHCIVYAAYNCFYVSVNVALLQVRSYQKYQITLGQHLTVGGTVFVCLYL